jgi:glycosyltransferase involved in cell wall biosynthesis
MMVPDIDMAKDGVSGIHTVVRAYYRVLPKYGIDLVPYKAEHDVSIAHAGMFDAFADVAMTHGIYFTADYNAHTHEWRANNYVVNSIRAAYYVTVPSPWVAETMRRDFRVDPIIIPHGVFYDEWQHNREHVPNTVLWAKNRTFQDVVDPTPVSAIAREMTDTTFVTTFAAPGAPRNVSPIGIQNREQIKGRVQKAAVVLSTIKETWGLLYAEALAAGTPVVTVNRGHVPLLVRHGVTGYCYQPGNLEDMKHGIEWCMKHRDILSKNCLVEAEKLSWDVAGERVARVARLAHKKKIDNRSMYV